MPDGESHPPDMPDVHGMEDQFRAAREAAERQFREYQEQIGRELSRNLSDAFGAAAAPTVRPALEAAPIRDLHRLEQADSHVRHSIVEACFYNLRLYSDLLPDRGQRPGFQQKLQANLEHLPDIHDELTRYFASRVGDHTAGALFPQEQAQVLHELGQVVARAERLLRDYDGEACRREFAESVPRHIDRTMAALGQITARLREIKVDLVGVLEQVVALHRDRLAAAGISIRFTNKNGEAAPIFGHRRQLLNAASEVVSNAATHGLAHLPGHKPRVIGIVLRLVTVGQQAFQIDVADSGSGIPREIQDALGVRGVTTGGTGEGLAMVRHIIEDEHLGSLAVLSREGTGTLVRIHLPRALAMPM